MTPGIYRHYRGDLYCVIAVCADSTNVRAGEKMVVYYSIAKGRLHVRAAEEFNESVKWPDGSKRARFEPIAVETK